VTKARAAVPRTSQRRELDATELTSGLRFVFTRDGSSVILGTTTNRGASAMTDDNSCIV
jgi:hypothetical protein